MGEGWGGGGKRLIADSFVYIGTKKLIYPVITLPSPLPSREGDTF
jgi:hypothetical protein